MKTLSKFFSAGRFSVLASVLGSLLVMFPANAATATGQVGVTIVAAASIDFPTASAGDTYVSMESGSDKATMRTLETCVSAADAAPVEEGDTACVTLRTVEFL
ncbi:MAG: hypothetical protein WA906_13010 [Pacificimonas sp.]